MEWISVKDRLPEPGEDVLVFHAIYIEKEGKLRRIDSHMEVKHYVPDDGIHAWGWYPNGLPIANSSHWMPLPEPPEL